MRDRPSMGRGVLVRTLAELYVGWAIEASCAHCVYAAYLSLAKLIARYGREFTLGDLARRLRCRVCRHRDAPLHPGTGPSDGELCLWTRPRRRRLPGWGRGFTDGERSAC